MSSRSFRNWSEPFVKSLSSPSSISQGLTRIERLAELVQQGAEARFLRVDRRTKLSLGGADRLHHGVDRRLHPYFLDLDWRAASLLGVGGMLHDRGSRRSRREVVKSHET